MSAPLEMKSLKISPKLGAQLAQLNAGVETAKEKFNLVISTIFDCSEYAGKELTVHALGGDSISFTENPKPESPKEGK